jgi:hypothetical protein
MHKESMLKDDFVLILRPGGALFSRGSIGAERAPKGRPKDGLKHKLTLSEGHPPHKGARVQSYLHVMPLTVYNMLVVLCTIKLFLNRGSF